MKLGLIGHPISHSQSPRLFKELRPEWQFDLIETPDFQEAINIFKASYDAITVTAPFKELAFKIADRHDDLCLQVGATNLLVKENGLITAYNTDVHGVRECLKECSKTLHKALIIGCGGAGKAAIVAALEMKLQTTIINRDEQKCIDLSIKLGGRLPEIKISKISDLQAAVAENDIIIYTLPVSIPELSQIDFSEKIIIEANYRSTALSTKKSRIYIEGEFWLRKQAEAAADIVSAQCYISCTANQK